LFWKERDIKVSKNTYLSLFLIEVDYGRQTNQTSGKQNDIFKTTSRQSEFGPNYNFIFLKNNTKKEIVVVTSSQWCWELYSSTDWLVIETCIFITIFHFLHFSLFYHHFRLFLILFILALHSQFSLNLLVVIFCFLILFIEGNC